MPTRKTQPTPEPATTDETPDEGDKPKRKTVSAMEKAPEVLAAMEKLDPEGNGVTLAALRDETGLPYRIVHNVTWRLEGSPEVRDKDHWGELRKPDERKIGRVGKGRTVLYAIEK